MMNNKFILWVFLLFPLIFVTSRSDQEVKLGICCKNSETFQIEEEACIKVDSAAEPFNEIHFQNFLQAQPNVIHERYRNSYENSDLSFRLTQQPISCPNGTSSLVILSSLNNSLLTINDKPLQLFPTTGYLKYGTDNFHPREYCINQIQEDLDFMEIIACKPQCSEENPCIPKCCDLDQVWDFSLYDEGPLRCRPAGEKLWTPKFYSDLRSKQPVELDNSRIITTHPRFWCQNDAFIYSLKKRTKLPKRDLFKILPDGSVWIKGDRKDNWTQFTPGTFCLDGGYNFEGVNKNASFSGDFEDTVLMDCGDHSSDLQMCQPAPENSNAYAISLVIASTFLLLTVVVYLLLWEKQNIHGWTSLCYFASLFAMYIFTALSRLDYLMFSQEENSLGCLTIAIGAHFFWLSTFCFGSCLNLDLWWTFRALRPTGSSSKGFKRFSLYAIFSLGVPSVIVGVALTLDHLYKDDLESNVIIPEYGKLNCFMDRQYALLPYLYGPIGFLLSFNLIFFSATVYDMYKIQQSTKFASSSSSKNSKQRQSIKLFAKLFLLMGIPWSFEVISYFSTPCGQIYWYWMIFDYINIFQAFAIFLVFSCKEETITSLENKFPSFKKFMTYITLTPEQSREFGTRWPKLQFLVKPFTRREKKNVRAFSSAKTVSTGAESSRKFSSVSVTSSRRPSTTSDTSSRKLSAPHYNNFATRQLKLEASPKV